MLAPPPTLDADLTRFDISLASIPERHGRAAYKHVMEAKSPQKTSFGRDILVNGQLLFSSRRSWTLSSTNWCQSKIEHSFIQINQRRNQNSLATQ